MSHFNLLVVGNGNIESRLEPFWELNMSPEDIENDWRAEWFDMTERVVTEYANGEREKGIPFKSEFGSEEEFARDWFGYVKRENTYGYWCNPNAKWDWFEVGGRWSGYFIYKENPRYPKDIIITDPKSRQCNAVRKCDLDVVAIYELRKESAEKAWTEAEGKDNGTRDFIYGIPEDMTKEQYIEYRVKRLLSFFAVLTEEGEWLEEGKMGWFGISTNDNPNWDIERQSMFDKLSEKTLLTVVDCHI